MNKFKLVSILMVLLALFAVGHTAERLVLTEYFTNAG